MASKWCILFFIAMVASIFYSSAAQRTHVVGDALWIVPPPVNFSQWASTQTFTIGDILLFNFTTGFHDVAEVTSAEYDACSSQSPISVSNTGPTNITLSSAGQHFYICTISGHCSIGQKLAITVSATPSPTPIPSPASVPAPTIPSSTPTTSPASVPAPAIPSPTPTTSPASVPAPTIPPPTSTSVPSPAPSPAPSTYVVGDALGWRVPPGDPIAYQTWASDKTFLVGDALVFNFTNNRHDVVQLTSKGDYDSCSNSSASTTINNGPARITLTTPGENFFICTFTGHCQAGQKLAVNVTGTPASISPSGRNGAPSSPTTPGISTPPSPSSAPNVVVAALPITLLSIVFVLLY